MTKVGRIGSGPAPPRSSGGGGGGAPKGPSVDPFGGGLPPTHVPRAPLASGRSGGVDAVRAFGARARIAVKNPLSWSDCPDPSALRHGSDVFLATTGSLAPFCPGGKAYPLRVAPGGDFDEVEVVGHVFDAAPSWIVADPWAPDLHHDPEMGFAVTFTGRTAEGRLAVGLAFAERPEGPYLERAPGPFLSSPEIGLIDSHVFFDARTGRRFFVWKEDWNDRPELGRRTTILVQELVLDGGQPKLVGDRVPVLQSDLPFEQDLVEGPSLVQRAGRYYLFYSAGPFHTPSCAASVARADHPMGPYEKLGRSFLPFDENWRGRGHGFAFSSEDGRDYFVCHGYAAARVGPPHPRVLLLFPLEWGDDGWPRLETAAGARPRRKRHRDRIGAPGVVAPETPPEVAGVERARRLDEASRAKPRP